VSAASGQAAIVAAVLVRDGRVLLCLRSRQRRWSPCMWDLPGGHVEPAAIAATLPVVRIIDHEVDMRVWIVREWSGDAINAAPEEHDAVGWFQPSQLERLSLAHPEYRGLLRRVGRASGASVPSDRS